MNHWIGIVGSSFTHLRLSTSTDYHYCMPEACEAGDLIGMYVTRRAFKNPGFFGIFIVEFKDPSKNPECKTYGTVTKKSDCSSYVQLKPIQLASKTISIELVKSNPILANSAFVKKNMLSSYFPASKREFDELSGLLNSNL